MTFCALCHRTEPETGTLCTTCFDTLYDDIAALPADVAALQTLPVADNGMSQKVTGTREQSVPVNLAAEEIVSDIAWRCGVWEPPVREAAGLAPVAELRTPERIVARAAPTLAHHLDAFAELGPTLGYPDGLDGGPITRSGLYGVKSLRRLHHRAASLVGLTRPATYLPGLCRGCGAAALTQQDGSPIVACGCCGRHVTADDYATQLAQII